MVGDTMATQTPTLLCIAGFDPSGGAGLQADIETAAALGVRAACALTCNTVQDSRDAKEVAVTAPDLLVRQIECLITDFDIAAIKTGLIPSTKSVEAVAETISKPVAGTDCSLVVDPVLCDGTGKALCDDGVVQAVRERLLPIAACATPNRTELAALVPEAETPAAAAHTLLAENCKAVLVTSEGGEGENLKHTLYLADGTHRNFLSPRLPGEFHGSGCTLSSAIAAHLALGKPLHEAVPFALDFTAQALERADAPGKTTQARKFPRRL